MGTGERLKILLVDDDAELCALMKEFFRTRDCTVDCAHDGREGLAQGLQAKHDLIILDGMLPVLDGFEVLRQLRRRSAIPVIMLTARAAKRDRIIGLDSGADDYLAKPFAPDELLARMRAVLRRYSVQQPQPELLRLGSLELYPTPRSVICSGETLWLTEIEFQILELLMRSSGRTVSRDEIAAVIYQRECNAQERASMDVHLSHLRKKIQGKGSPVIRAVRGIGYLLTSDGDE